MPVEIARYIFAFGLGFFLLFGFIALPVPDNIEQNYYGEGIARFANVMWRIGAVLAVIGALGMLVAAIL